MGGVEEAECRSCLRVCCRGREHATPHELLHTVPVNGGKVAPAKQDVKLMDAIGVNHGERSTTSLRACARVTGVMAKLDCLPEAP